MGRDEHETQHLPQERRVTDESIVKLSDKVDKLTVKSDALSKKLTDHINEETDELVKLREAIEPIVGIMHDIAAVGRAGRVLKSVLTWFVVVGGSLAAIIHYLPDVKK